MNKVAVLNVVGLTPWLIGEHTPNLRALRDAGRMATIRPGLPAVTCSTQTDYLTGCRPSEHGIVGNGWYFRDTAEVRLWQQADSLVQRPRIWDEGKRRNPAFTCANLFWWYAMYSSADYTVTPRPMYLADGRKVPDLWTHPASLREVLQEELGAFPLFKFWGPGASIECSQWIADAAVRVDESSDPTLSLIYLPHLDFSLQKFGPAGPEIARELRAIDAVAGRLIEYFHGRGARIVVLSEYGIESVDMPVHLNRVLRNSGLVQVRMEQGTERLDAGASRAFAVADHQVAHVYVRYRADLPAVRRLLEATLGVARVLDADGKREAGLDHPRSGELIAVAEQGCWFTYYFWLDDRLAPDYARTVDIHRKPGYDPAELFFDPARPALKIRTMAKVIARKAGIRNLLNVVPLDASLVRGSHGRVAEGPDNLPVFITAEPAKRAMDKLDARAVNAALLDHLFD